MIGTPDRNRRCKPCSPWQVVAPSPFSNQSVRKSDSYTELPDSHDWAQIGRKTLAPTSNPYNATAPSSE